MATRWLLLHSMPEQRLARATQIVTNGGRVLGVTATGKDSERKREQKPMQATEWVTFDRISI